MQQLEEIRSQVGEELEHIPGRPTHHQSALRMEYWARRMNSLGKKANGAKSAYDVLQESIDGVKRYYPDAKLEYDRAFFEDTT